MLKGPRSAPLGECNLNDEPKVSRTRASASEAAAFWVVVKAEGSMGGKRGGLDILRFLEGSEGVLDWKREIVEEERGMKRGR